MEWRDLETFSFGDGPEMAEWLAGLTLVVSEAFFSVGLMGMLMHGKHTGCGRGTCSGELEVSCRGEGEVAAARS